MMGVGILRHLHITLSIEYIFFNAIHIRQLFLRYIQMQGNIHQIPVLLAVLALIYIANHSSAKYNLVGRDDKITTMKVNVEKGISYIFTPIKKQINVYSLNEN